MGNSMEEVVMTGIAHYCKIFLLFQCQMVALVLPNLRIELAATFQTFQFCPFCLKRGSLASGPEGAVKGQTPASNVGAPSPKWCHRPTQPPTSNPSISAFLSSSK